MIIYYIFIFITCFSIFISLDVGITVTKIFKKLENNESFDKFETELLDKVDSIAERNYNICSGVQLLKIFTYLMIIPYLNVFIIFITVLDNFIDWVKGERNND